MNNQHPIQQCDARAEARSRARFWLLGIVLLAPLGMGARDCEEATVGADCTEDGAADNPACVCEYDGKYYAAGDTFMIDCNHASCGKDGQVSSTNIGCIGDAGGPGGGGDTCGGLTGGGCDDDEYCDFAPAAHCGAADQTGTCTLKPEVCPAIYAPVCGCDDKTYGNECEAAGKGVAVASSGECQGGGSGDGCDYDGKHYAPGESFPATDGCNTCTCAQDGGVGCSQKACNGGGGATCGGLQGGTCKDGEFCNFAPDAICGAADATGTCEAVPSACTLEYAPVCGCDDKTYGNACDAHSHGTSVASQGECNGGDGGTSAGGCDVDGMHYEPGESFPAADGCNQCTCGENGSAGCTKIGCDPGKTCGGFAGIQCDGEQYCDFPPATMCGSGDQSGTCKDRPGACDTVLKQVCGCDGNDYSNACFAAIEGVSVLHSGVCK